MQSALSSSTYVRLCARLFLFVLAVLVAVLCGHLDILAYRHLLVTLLDLVGFAAEGSHAHVAHDVYRRRHTLKIFCLLNTGFLGLITRSMTLPSAPDDTIHHP